MSATVRKPKTLLLNDDDYDEDLEFRASKFLRGEPADLEALKDKKLKGQLAVREDHFRESAHAAAKTEKWLGPTDVGYLVPDEMEKTNRITQDRIALEVDILSSRNQYDIVLNDFGPYSLDFTASGRHMTLAGRKGHLAIVDMTELRVIKEFQVRETVRDVVFLHNELFFAAAQKKYPYIYNREGTEIHCLKEHGAVLKLQFLKNHFLLASLNEFGQLHYQDVTTGVMVGNYRTGQGRTDVMQVNPFNGVIGVGHSRGMLSMWKPTSAAPLVQMLCHQGAITALAFHSNGYLMATAGMERKIKIWDLRKYGAVQTITGHAKSMEFSQKGMLAAATGSSVQVLGDLSGSQTYSQYMTHRIAKGYQAQKVAFRPYEDVLAIGHSKGYSSILIPGSGEPNYDSWVANPFETPKQRREREVHGLLDKLPPETIMLDPTKIGSVKPTRKKEKLSKQEREAEKEAAIEEAKNITVKKKTKGRSKSSRVTKKKQEAIKNAKRPFIEQEKNEEDQSKTKRKRVSEDNNDLPKSLQRFAKRKATK